MQAWLIVFLVIVLIYLVVTHIGWVLLVAGILGGLAVLRKVLSTEPGRKAAGTVSRFGLVAMGIALGIVAFGAANLRFGHYLDRDAWRLAYVFGDARPGQWVAWLLWSIFGALIGLSVGASIGLWRTRRKGLSIVVGLALCSVPFIFVPAASAIRNPLVAACRATCKHAMPIIRRKLGGDTARARQQKQDEIQQISAAHTAAANKFAGAIFKERQRLRSSKGTANSEETTDGQTEETVVHPTNSTVAGYEAKGKALDAQYDKDVESRKAELRVLQQNEVALEAGYIEVPKAELDGCTAACVRDNTEQKPINCALASGSYDVLSSCGGPWQASVDLVKLGP
jgi:hypothetical protein